MKSLTGLLQRSFSSWGTKLASVALIITVALFSLAAGSGDDNDQERGKHNAPQLEGSWLVTVTLDIPDGPPPFEALVSHTAGGVVIISDPSVFPLWPMTTAFHGTWTKKGGRDFAFKAVLFQYDNGLWKGIAKEAITIARGGDTYQGKGTIDFYDPEGNLAASYGASTLASRIKAE